MSNKQISGERKTIFYVGGVLIVIGFLTFGSVFVSGALNFGNFKNFEARGRSRHGRWLEKQVGRSREGQGWRGRVAR